MKLQCFLYLLMRDTAVPGEVERLVGEIEKGYNPVFSNGHLADYAAELAARLMRS